MRILIVEDERKMSSFLERGLKEEGYAVDVAGDGETGWEYVSANDYDVVILDWMLPRMNGLELCEKIRRAGLPVGIMMLTVRDDVQDKIRGLDRGVDDYLTKPFSFEELLARLRALLRRPRETAEKTTLESNNLSLDLVARRVFLGDQEISLSQKEFALLEFLMRRKGEVVTRSQIAEHVWDLHFDPMSNTIDVYINFLRKKIDGNRPKSWIETLRGQGYRFVDA
jgi:DNA-binding response OmpR family regulator